jgi:hypothetical protein
VAALALQGDRDDQIRMRSRRGGHGHWVKHLAVHEEAAVDGHWRDDPWYADRRPDSTVQGAGVQPHLASGQQIDGHGREADGKILDPSVSGQLDHSPPQACSAPNVSSPP